MKRPFPFHSNLVWPPAILVGLSIILYGLVGGSFWLIEQSVPAYARPAFETPEIIGYRAAVLGFVAGTYALYRLLRFHPALSPAYAEWLKLTPWTADLPLPAGPVHLVWQDAVVVGALTVVGIWDHVNPLVPVTVFMCVYLIVFTLLLALTRRWGPCLVLGFLWPILMLPGIAPVPSPKPILPAIGVLIAVVCVIWYGHRQSLKAFPWNFIKASPRSLAQQTDIQIQGVSTPGTAGTQYNLGWPYLALSPKVRPPSISQTTNLALGILAGWWSFCIIKAASIGPVPGGFILFIAITAALIRLGIYIIGAATPFNIFGRLATGRIIVPGYDKVFVTPLAVVIVAIVGCIIIDRSGAWYPLTESAVIGVLCCVLFGGGPSLRSWALTGVLRLHPLGIGNANKQMSVRRV